MFDGFYRQPPSYENLRLAAQELKQSYPFLKVFPIGKSVLGRSIYAFGFGNLRQNTLYVGGVHGMEWLTVLLLLRFTEALAQAAASGRPLAEVDVARILESRSLVLIPCLNPDGVEIALYGAGTAKHLCKFVDKMSAGETGRWQANARGVDLNHNFDAGFAQLKRLEQAAGITSPGPTRYGGVCPHSEPETNALVRFCAATQPRQAYAFHSQGEEIYYRYGPCTPARAQLMAQVLACASGYIVTEPEKLASHGGFKDWFIEKLHRPAFTIEIGRGKNPLAVEELEPIYARLLEMLLISALL